MIQLGENREFCGANVFMVITDVIRAKANWRKDVYKLVNGMFGFLLNLETLNTA